MKYENFPLTGSQNRGRIRSDINLKERDLLHSLAIGGRKESEL